MGIDVLSTAEGCSSRAPMIRLSSQTCNGMIQRMDVSAPQLRQITAYLCELLQHVIYGRAELIARFCMSHSPGEAYILHSPFESC